MLCINVWYWWKWVDFWTQQPKLCFSHIFPSEVTAVYFIVTFPRLRLHSLQTIFMKMPLCLTVSQCPCTSCWTSLRTRGRSWRWGTKTLLVCWSKFLNGMTRSCWSLWFPSSKNCPSSWRIKTTWWVMDLPKNSDQSNEWVGTKKQP